MSTEAKAATIIIDTLDRDYTNRDGTWTNRDECIAYITAALATERMRVWEEIEIEWGPKLDKGYTAAAVLYWCRKHAEGK